MRALGRFVVRRPHDPDFAAFAKLPGDGLFLDVGASIGQSALSFRIYNRRSPIVSLEPLPWHRGDLRFVKHVVRRHRFIIAGAAEESRRATLFVPVLGSYRLPAQSSLAREDAVAVLRRLEAEGADRKRLRLEEVEIELRRLDELGLDPAFVKIDVEGSELGVLEGMLETIERCTPVLMIERSEGIDRVVERLAERDYEAFVFDPAVGFVPYEGQAAINVFFLSPTANGYL
jgi:FkbM family methyltransferase